jgi:hypothetical protein
MLARERERSGLPAEALHFAIRRESYFSQLETSSPASITQVSVFSPPSTASLPDTLSRDLRKSFPCSPYSLRSKPS